MHNNTEKVLIYGYGNPGRQDDAIGNEFIKLTKKWIIANDINNVETDCNYQLNIEDAEKIANFDKVFFVDASKENIKHYKISQISPLRDAGFSTHAAHPSYILYLCNQVFDRNPLVYLLQIKGYEWKFLSPLTSKAKQNLNKAFKKLINLLKDCKSFSLESYQNLNKL